jgi:hypothetical protein
MFGLPFFGKRNRLSNKQRVIFDSKIRDLEGSLENINFLNRNPDCTSFEPFRQIIYEDLSKFTDYLDNMYFKLPQEDLQLFVQKYNALTNAYRTCFFKIVR